MPKYKYQGRSGNGQAVNGQIEANSSDGVASLLMSRSITPISIAEVSTTETSLDKLNELIGANKVNPTDLIMFCRQMFTITKSGIPLTRGIRGLAASIRHPKFCDILNEVADRLETGSSLSQCLRRYPKTFNGLFVSMIAVGESSGKLDQVFKQIGLYIDRDETTRKHIKSAMRYPMFVLLALVGALVIVNLKVIPAFAEFFGSFDVPLPIITRILIGTSDFFINYGVYLLVFVIALCVGAYQYVITEKGSRHWGKLRLNLPIVGGLIGRASMARYSRSFSLMLSAGVPINQSLSLCAAAIDNAYLTEKIQHIRHGVERGESLLHTHMQADMFTPLVLQMISVGEESGQVEELLQEVAEFYEREVEYDLKTLTDRIEPILIVFMAVFVGLLALGIFVPMWSLMEVQS